MTGRTRIGALILALSVAAIAAASAGTSGGFGIAGDHPPVTGKLRTGAGTATSTNWSGYAAYGATFSDVQGNWQQPTATCTGLRHNQVSLAAFWVGLDGYLNNTVEQTGTEADCDGTTPVYYAWYEFYPANVIVLNTTADPVSPHDVFHADVSSTSLTLHDVTAGWSVPIPVPAKGYAFSSAEWIAEGPSNMLTNFGTVDFTNAAASSGATLNGPIDSTAWNHDAITMVTRGGPHATPRATPTGLSGGTAFNIQWQQP
jgi:hypothetical protein